MNIRVDSTLLGQSASELGQYSKELSEFQNDLKKVQRSLSQCSGLAIDSKFKSIHAGIGKQISDIGKLQKVAEDAAEEYRICEAKLTGSEREAKNKSTDKAESSNASLLDFNDESESHNARLQLLGYEKTEESFDAYVLKATGDDTIDFGAITVGTAVGFSGLAIRGGASSSRINVLDANLGSNTKYKGGKVTAKPLRADPEYMVSSEEYNGETKQRNSFNAVEAKVSAEVGATAAVLNYKTTIGNDDISGSVDADVKLLDADIGGEFEASFGTDGLAILGKAEVGASLAEVGGSVSTNIYGIEAGANVSAEIGFGASFEAGYKDGELTFEIGAAVGIGGKVGFNIKLPNLW